MKQNIIKTFFVLLTMWVCIPIFAQLPALEQIKPEAYGTQYSLLVGTGKTTVLLFPDKIAPGGVDLGSSDLIANTINGVDNILRVKAATENFAPTNLTVVTTDGKVHSFYVSFSLYPDDRPIDLGKQANAEKAQAVLKDRKLNDAQLKKSAGAIIALKPFLKKPKTKSYGMQFSLKGIYAQEDVLFFRFELGNKSPIDFTTDFMRFYIRDQKRLKRTADQELELQPLAIFPDNKISTTTSSTQTIIVAFKKFTIADHKNMVIQLFEKNGDRHMVLKIKGKVLMQASKL
ncbi:MAG: conjugative transposon protein TraN [Pseudopedobacter saltans]|uniref:Conjugative transposon protein TraN n=1 Tax=Pseudopedobacter saltans TaxID=151895 RepID=A0A2W5F090_9SPHI|nr:MAG: conjugative transposon protein TraN [Pseudopedobacter saltans]